MTLPLIITAPHGKSGLPTLYLDRVCLDTHQIWQMSDPFTDFTAGHPDAFRVIKAKAHRMLGDVNRDIDDPDMFRRKDFYHRLIWKEDARLSRIEKKKLLIRNILPFREEIIATYHRAYRAGFRHIVHIDHHNTSMDHPAKDGAYLPPLTLGNYGDAQGEHKRKPLSCSPRIIKHLQKSLRVTLPSVCTEVNKVYEGSSILRFLKREVEPTFPDLKIEAIILEWNLNLVWNSLSHKLDTQALHLLRNGINTALTEVAETL